MRAYCLLTAMLNAVTALVVGSLVLFKGRSGTLHRTYVLACLAVLGWSAGYILWQLATSAAQAIVYCRFLMASAIAIYVFYAHHFLLLLERNRPRLIIVTYILGGIFAVLSIFGTTIVAGVKPQLEFPFWPIAGRLYIPMLLFSSAPILVQLKYAFEAMRKSEGMRRRQLHYVFWGSLIAYIGGSTNYPLWFGIPIRPYGNPGASIHLIMTSYAIMKHHLMGIHVVIRKTAIYSAVSAVLIAIYVGIISVLTKVLEGYIPQASLLSSAVAAAAMALLFHPLQLHVQRWIDRRFPRESLNQALLREATSDFVHEIKRPLANISMPVQLALMDLDRFAANRISRDELIGQLRQRLEYVLGESMEAGDTIEAIRALSSSIPSAHETINLKMILKRIVAREQARIAHGNIQVEQSFDVEPISIDGNAKQLEIALGNIVKNAIDAMMGMNRSRSRNLRLNIHRTTHITVDIEDTGPGISDADLSRLFDPWFSTKGSGGMGIGLFLTREMLRLHNASIDVQSQVGKGSRFRIHFPFPMAIS